LIPRPFRIALVCLLAVLGGAPAAHAAPSQQMLFDAPRDLLNADTRPGALEELDSLGVRALRVVLYWRSVAPDADGRQVPAGDLSDPASYDWGQYDALLAAARERGWRVLLTVTTPGPKWAMRGRRDHVTRPSPTHFGRFMTAVGRRYGDQVDQWSILNEPNHPKFLLPQYEKGKGAVSPGIYRQLFNAAHRALRATGNGRDQILIGETAPRGTGRVVAPLRFLRGTLCLNARYRKRPACGRLPATGWAHHPYTTRSGPFFVPPGRDDVTIGVLSRLTRALDRAGRAGAIRRGMPIWLTEFGIQSTPDRFLGVSLAKQVEYRAMAERLAYGNRRVRAFSQYLLTDDNPIEGARTAAQRYGGFESGLRFATGRAKPSLNGFRLPAAALRDGRTRVSLWGMARPAGSGARVEILYQDRGSRTFRRLKTVRTNRYGAFTTRTVFREGRRYRLRWNDQQGAPVRVMSRSRR
jgi:hypothetical protein